MKRRSPICVGGFDIGTRFGYRRARPLLFSLSGCLPHFLALVSLFRDKLIDVFYAEIIAVYLPHTLIIGSPRTIFH